MIFTFNELEKEELDLKIREGMRDLRLKLDIKQLDQEINEFLADMDKEAERLDLDPSFADMQADHMETDESGYPTYLMD